MRKIQKKASVNYLAMLLKDGRVLRYREFSKRILFYTIHEICCFFA